MEWGVAGGRIVLTALGTPATIRGGGVNAAFSRSRRCSSFRIILSMQERCYRTREVRRAPSVRKLVSLTEKRVISEPIAESNGRFSAVSQPVGTAQSGEIEGRRVVDKSSILGADKNVA